MKQTAIEWLEKEIVEQQLRYIELSRKDKTKRKEVDAILTATTLLKMKCKQAKEMEKQQIKNAYDQMRCVGNFENGEQYYNETYNKTS